MDLKQLHPVRYHIAAFIVLTILFIALATSMPQSSFAQTATTTATTTSQTVMATSTQSTATTTQTSITGTTTPSSSITVISTPTVVQITSIPTNIPLCEITRALKVGSNGDDVRCLQRFLNWAGYTIAPSGSGSPGNESNYFGSLTANAVIRWQNANASQVLVPAGLSSGTGLFGQLSFNQYVRMVRQSLGLPAQ